MCVAVMKPVGAKIPTKETFKKCFDHNRDGAGYMYWDEANRKVIIRKGFMTFKEFYSDLKDITKTMDITNTAMAFHFRISTAGNVDKGNCHPYPITSNENLLRAQEVQCSMGMIHNGIIHMYTNGEGLLNDTQVFIKNVLSKFKKHDKNFILDKDYKTIVSTLIGTYNKLGFLLKNGTMVMLGDWKKYDDCYFSNLFWSYSYVNDYYSTSKYHYSYIGDRPDPVKKLAPVSYAHSTDDDAYATGKSINGAFDEDCTGAYDDAIQDYYDKHYGKLPQ